MTAATILAKNVAPPLVPSTSDRTFAARARAPPGGIAGRDLSRSTAARRSCRCCSWATASSRSSRRLLLSLTPAPLATRAGAIAGILAGETVVGAITASGTTLAKLLPGWPSAVTDLNIGVVALGVNVLVLLVVSAIARPPGSACPGLSARNRVPVNHGAGVRRDFAASSPSARNAVGASC